MKKIGTLQTAAAAAAWAAAALVVFSRPFGGFKWNSLRNPLGWHRVARFFLVQNTKTGKYITNYHELYQMSIKYNKRP
jgi:hypothetical protein